MNVELLNKVVKYHEEMPERFSMNTWYESFDPGAETEYTLTPVPVCGTIACIAGTVGIITGHAEPHPDPEFEGIIRYSEPGLGWFDDAQNQLGLDRYQARRLFYTTENMSASPYHWPEQFVEAYYDAKTQAERVEVLKARVAHFIATDGQE